MRCSLISLSSSTFYNFCKLERFTQNFILILLLVVHLLVTEPAAACACESKWRALSLSDDLRGGENPEYLLQCSVIARPEAPLPQSQTWDPGIIYLRQKANTYTVHCFPRTY